MTDDEKKIDFSALDPARDEARWAGLVEATTTRAHAKHIEVSGVLRWTRAAVIASALALAAGVLLILRSSEPPRAREADAILLGNEPDVELVIGIGGPR